VRAGQGGVLGVWRGRGCGGEGVNVGGGWVVGGGRDRQENGWREGKRREGEGGVGGVWGVVGGGVGW